MADRPFEDTYVGQLRSLVGSRTLIAPGARAFITDRDGRVLLVCERDHGAWALPAGGIELGESIMDCLRREVREETGLEVLSATAVAIYSEPRFNFINAHGNSHQMFAVLFRVDEWRGDVMRETDETSDARWFPVDDSSELFTLLLDSIEDLLWFV
jgi:8-oxo-dGTP pyrophosphatase MutT (NUDIX family)